MKFKVTSAMRVKTTQGVREIHPGQLIDLSPEKAMPFVDKGKLTPINDHNPIFSNEGNVTKNSDHQHQVDERHPLTYPVLPEAIAKVDAIRDKALALGWTENGLYQTKGRFRFPCGQDFGLVCFLEKVENIGEVTKQYIEIIRPSGVRQRFYNRDVDQPWITKEQ
jgi:hypothetical protein